MIVIAARTLGLKAAFWHRARDLLTDLRRFSAPLFVLNLFWVVCVCAPVIPAIIALVRIISCFFTHTV
jgi:hypothetical protein